MRYQLLAGDYDGTLATGGRVDPSTVAALKRLRASGRSLVLVTGRQVDDLWKACPQLDLFDRVVAENGALLFRPSDRSERILGEPPPQRLIEELRRRGVTPLALGRVIAATHESQKDVVLQAIRELGLELQLSFNKGAVMVLPSGVNKASGLQAALGELGVSTRDTVGIGDAENDHAFLALCGCSVAVANALPALKKRVDHVTSGDHGTGVVELIERLLGSDLAELGIT